MHISSVGFQLAFAVYTAVLWITADCFDCILQALREKCLQLDDDVHTLNDRLKLAQDVIAEKDYYIEVCVCVWSSVTSVTSVSVFNMTQSKIVFLCVHVIVISHRFKIGKLPLQ